MKRLIKKSEFFNAFSKNGIYCEVFKNPTSNEYYELRINSKYGIRGIINKSGDIYAWDGEVLHKDIFNANIGVRDDGLHIEQCNDELFVYCFDAIKPYEYLKNYQSKIEDFMNMKYDNTYITFGYLEYGSLKINEYLQLCEENKLDKDKMNNYLKEKYMTAKLKSRLKKMALMDINVFDSTLKQLGLEGRKILKSIEEYKFKLDQTTRIVSNDKNLADKLIQKKKQLDVAAGQVYSIVFDVENMDIVNEYSNQQINTNPVTDNNENKKFNDTKVKEPQIDNIKEKPEEDKPETTKSEKPQKDKGIDKKNEEELEVPAEEEAEEIEEIPKDEE